MGGDAAGDPRVPAHRCAALTKAGEPKPISAPEAIVFDLYGTLLDVSALADHLRPSIAPVDADDFVALWRRKQLEYSWLHTLMGRYVDFWRITEAALRHASSHFGVRLDTTAEQRITDGWLRLPAHPEVVDALTRMARTPLAILSNGSPRMLEAGLPADLRERFSEILSVDLVRAYKPAPAAYRLAAQRLELPPARILFVSSNRWDTAGAAVFGFRVALIDRTGAAREELPGKPHLVASDLAELARALDVAPQVRGARKVRCENG